MEHGKTHHHPFRSVFNRKWAALRARRISGRRNAAAAAVLDNEYLEKIKIKIIVLGFECQRSGTYAKRAKQAIKKRQRRGLHAFLNYLVFLRPAADRAVSIFSWVLSRGRSYEFLWAGSIIQKKWE
jgi:hypothetical protein